MTTPKQRWKRVTELFEQALERSREERPDFLNAACAGNAELLREVESLLAQHDAETGFLESPAVEIVAEQITGSTHHLSIGKQLGQYRIESFLGRGGMGEVYVAQDKLGRKVALKLLTQRFAGDKSGIARFQQEARTLLALNHPHIVTIYDIDEIDGVYYIASELVEGETLHQRLVAGDMSLDDVLEITIQVATALAAAHEKGIVHRDIKPDNVMIRRDGFVKVLDFGIAKLTEKYSAESEAPTAKQVRTAEGVAVGTPAYMSPEQARGLLVDARSDLWSLGVLIYEAVAGRRPFPGETTPDIINAILEKTPAPLTRYAADVPEALEWMVSRSLRKDKDGRYQTANELLIDLKELKTRIEIAKVTASEIPNGATRTRTHATAAGVAAATAPASSAEYIVTEIKRHKRGVLLLVAALIILVAAGTFSYFKYFANRPTVINSIAILPFDNQTKTEEVDYLSDGMTESLINNLSQISDLSVKARSSVFRYKGKDIEPQQAASELSVQAILNGRVVQRGEDLTLYLSLVDGRNGNQLWGQQYDRKLTDLVSLQSEIARDVSRRLRTGLSSAEEQRVARNYTANAEAYQLYLKGRYHILKLKLSETQKGISYFQQAIAMDPSYALAYVGLAEANRALTLTGEMPSTEYMPKAKAAAQKAIEIDETLAEAHSALGMIIMWYDWDWNEAEKQCKRALELNPNSSDAHFVYAHLLSNTGRHAGALAEAKRARELDPLNLRIGTVEGEFLIHAGRADEALARFQKIFELDSNFWFAHVFASSAYIEKGMFAEASAEAQKARDLSEGNAQPFSFLGYALAKSGKQAEARAVLEELLKRSTERYVPPYYVAMIYNGLGQRDEALAWLERGFQQRDPRMALLKVEPKWNNLRADPHFQDLMRRVGF